MEESITPLQEDYTDLDNEETDMFDTNDSEKNTANPYKIYGDAEKTCNFIRVF